MTEIYNPQAFIKWATNKFGENWFEVKSIQDIYGIEQLINLYPHLFTIMLDDNKFNLNISFKSEDVKLNEDRLMYEANGIYNNLNTRKNRTLQQVIDCTKQGHILEQYLIDNHNFKDNKVKYMDLISPCDMNVDCKTVKKEYLDNNKDYYSNMIKFMNDKNINYGCGIDYIVIYTVEDNIYKYNKTLKLNKNKI